MTMRTVTKTINVYKFEELTKEAQDKVIQTIAPWQVENGWYEDLYEDAKTIGLQVIGFEVDGNRFAKGRFSDSAMACAEKIQANHGEECETRKTADKFLSDRIDLFVGDSEADESELEEQFLKDILSDYADMLQREYDYLTSREAIIETINANEYEFTEDGKIFNA